VTHQNKHQRLEVDAMGELMPTVVKARQGRPKKVKMVEVRPFGKSILHYFSPKP
jgi:hypothetical protein